MASNMTSPEYETFGMTDRDMDDIYEPMRKKRRMSKNQTTYGIWASSDEDGDDRIGFTGGNKKRTARDYTAPINFVSGGVKLGDKVIKEDDEHDDDDDEGALTDSDEEGTHVRTLKRPAAKSSRGFGVSQPFVTENSGIGSWEKHTKGIGQKLLEKMGHVAGKGLGVNLQGIITPIEATLRKGRGAIGLYGSEKNDKHLPVQQQDDEDAGDSQPRLMRWKKGEKGKVEEKKYMSVEELIKKKSSKYDHHSSSTHTSNVKILDMRGKQQKLLTGYHTINSKQHQPMEHDSHDLGQPLFDLPELINNLDLLNEMTEERVIKAHNKLACEEDAEVNLDYEIKRNLEAYDEEEKEINKMEDIVAILNQCRYICSRFALMEAVDRCSDLLIKLKSDYYQEYVMYDLCSDVTAIITPSVENEFKNWDPIVNPKQGSNVMTLIREVLSSDSPQLGYEATSGMPQEMEPYDSLLWQFVVPKIRVAVDLWNVRQPHLMLEILEYWQPVLPPWMMTKLLDQCIYAKVKAELNLWEPHNDPIPVQTWVQPWALIMEDKRNIFYSTIRDKLGKTFAFWEPYDPTGKVIITSWIGLFDQHDMEDFVVRHVLPKLLVCLQSISFSVKNQNLKQWNLVMDWIDILPHQSMVAALVEHFFPSLYGALSAWTSSRSYAKLELNLWFTTWLSNFPEKLKSDQDIKKMSQQCCDDDEPGNRYTSNSKRGL